MDSVVEGTSNMGVQSSVMLYSVVLQKEQSGPFHPLRHAQSHVTSFGVPALPLIFEAEGSECVTTLFALPEQFAVTLQRGKQSGNVPELLETHLLHKLPVYGHGQ
jgi:hypothetical protein